MDSNELNENENRFWNRCNNNHYRSRQWNLRIYVPVMMTMKFPFPRSSVGLHKIPISAERLAGRQDRSRTPWGTGKPQGLTLLACDCDPGSVAFPPQMFASSIVLPVCIQRNSCRTLCFNNTTYWKKCFRTSGIFFTLVVFIRFIYYSCIINVNNRWKLN